ncbi:hypothetical protein TELCIR_02482 [Teladorsagia circumcincta]|uniref:Uncharacterized protein n=1 Tax=Teladorsagia circumcincta TaxID=45464 RepID=A0A2G9UYX5_TELCI|nr:hypothetical protein TELCIR_02482 [Teladorsagia circumcincta]
MLRQYTVVGGGSWLSPPKDDEVLPKNGKERSSKEKAASGSRSKEKAKMDDGKSEEQGYGLFDKTQWERTRFALEAARRSSDNSDVKPAFMMDDQQPRETPLIGESRQSVAVRGEYLNEKPKFTIALLVVELMCEAHILRACLLCANITIMAFDDDFDIGSIIVLAATPIHLILVAIHIFIAVKPKRE